MSNLKLNLPSFEPLIKNSSGGLMIRDIVRKKFLILTPEEWVRQHFLNYLIHHLGYSPNLIRSEIGLRYHLKQKRADIIVFDNNGKPFLLVECKSFEIPISSETIFQAAIYQSVIETKYIVLTNGISHFYYKNVSGKFVEIDALPKK